MSRTKGAKDKQPRNMNPNSLQNIPESKPGYASKSARVYGPKSDVLWWTRLESHERGQGVTKLRKEQA